MRRSGLRVVGPLLATALLAGAPLLLAGGCIAVGGSSRVEQPTLGRQLQDLRTARESGAISEQEYNDVKTRMLRGEWCSVGRK